VSEAVIVDIVRTATGKRLDGIPVRDFMTPDPVVTSWNTNTIQITIPDYSNYTIGISLITIYLEVNVSTKSTNKGLLYLR